MPKNRICIPCSFVALMLAVASVTTAGYAQTYPVLYNFGTNSGDPQYPFFSGIVAQGRDGNMYSTTPSLLARTRPTRRSRQLAPVFDAN